MLGTILLIYPPPSLVIAPSLCPAFRDSSFSCSLPMPFQPDTPNLLVWSCFGGPPRRCCRGTKRVATGHVQCIWICKYDDDGVVSSGYRVRDFYIIANESFGQSLRSRCVIECKMPAGFL